MIVSDHNKYLFLEMPHTASTATSRELIDHYDGRLVFRERHAPYDQFARIATARQRKYFVFAGIRNPLDTIVTTYLKGVRTGLIRSDLNFPMYFDRTYHLPYANFVSRSAEQIDFWIRFEALQADFEACLAKMRVEQVRPLPQRNRTIEKSNHFLDYYTPEIIPKVKRVLGPYMKEWGYDFPPEWGEYRFSPLAKSVYYTTKTAKTWWWAYRSRWKGSLTPL